MGFGIWNLMGIFEILWDFVGFYGISWDFMGFFGFYRIYRDLSGYFLLKCAGFFRINLPLVDGRVVWS